MPYTSQLPISKFASLSAHKSIYPKLYLNVCTSEEDSGARLRQPYTLCIPHTPGKRNGVCGIPLSFAALRGPYPCPYPEPCTALGDYRRSQHSHAPKRKKEGKKKKKKSHPALWFITFVSSVGKFILFRSITIMCIYFTKNCMSDSPIIHFDSGTQSHASKGY